jgi:hypothetical protein
MLQPKYLVFCSSTTLKNAFLYLALCTLFNGDGFAKAFQTIDDRGMIGICRYVMKFFKSFCPYVKQKMLFLENQSK